MKLDRREFLRLAGAAGLTLMAAPGAARAQSGRETFAVLRAIDPKVPIVIMSGYSQDGDAQSLIDAGAAGFLQKPFSMAQLAAQVRNGLRR